MLHSKALHYPSGFPMPRSPPLFICSSPGPDPYRSNDNVYEELEHRGRFSDCDRQLHSDEDFAEDELSLPGELSLNKSSSENTTVATIYQERGAGSTSSNANESSAMYIERNRIERNSLLSSASSSANDNNSRPNMRNSSSSNESNHHNTLNQLNNNQHTSESNAGSTMGFFRFKTSRPNTCKAKSSRQKTNNFSMDNLNSSAKTPVDEVPSQGSSGNSSGNNNTGSSTASNGINNNSDPISASVLNGNHIEGDTNNNSNICGRNNYYGTESEVERRNRINAQLSNPTLNVATIFRDRNIRYHPTRANANYYAPPQHRANRANNNNETNNRSRTNPRPDRRRAVDRENSIGSNGNNNAANNNQDYLYHEPVYHENMVYDPYTSFNGNNNGGSRNQIYHQPYILPEFTTFRNFNNLNNPHQPLYNSALGSDSGYSQNTQTSGRNLWGRRKRVSNNNNNGNTIAMPVASDRNETTDTYEGS